MKKSRLRAFFTNQRSAMIIRWWAAGAIYFFIGWGTLSGSGQSMIGFVFSLGLVMGLFNILIVNPALRMLFNIGPKRPQHENTVAQRISDHLVELLRSLFIVFSVAMLYQMINRMIIAILDLQPTAVPFPGEPIMFGVFYIFVFWCLELIANKIKTVFVNNRHMQLEK